MRGILIRIAPIIFVVLWSTGYIAAKYAVPEAEPMAFLTWRYALVVVILMPLVLFWRLPWPSRPLNYLHLCITGVCCHCVGLGGVFLAIDRQVEAGVSALIMALQPVLAAAVAAVFLRERLSARQLLGLTLGFAGVALVVSDRLSSGAGTMTGVAWNLLGVVAFTVGTFYQKVCNQHANPFIGAVVQFAAAAAACFLLSLLLGGNGIRWVPQVIGALAWSVLVLSITATMVLYWLIRRGAMAEVSSLFYLVPVSAALLAWPLLGERLTIIAFGGMLVTVAGVALVTRPAARAS